MPQYRKIDASQVALTNKYNLIRCLIFEGPINRAAIAKRIGLSIPTVMAITEDLLEKNLIRSLGKGESSGGKPPEMLEMTPDCFYYIGVDVGRTTIRAAAVNAVSEAAAQAEEATGDPAPEKDFVGRLGKIVTRLAASLNTSPDRILGAGIAMPGLIEAGTGRVLFSPDFGWQDIPLKAWLEEEIPFPVTVENANRALALNESFVPGEENGHTAFVVNLGYGIGAALVMGEQLYTGASGTSGEIGHITVQPRGPRCHCGNSGCLEAVASGAAIAARGKELLERRGGSKLRELCGGDPRRVDAKLVFEAAAGGDREAAKITAAAAEYIGMGLATAINVLDPGKLILCGGLMKNGPGFFDRIRAAIEKHRMRQAGRALVISAGVHGDFSTAAGACRVLANNLWWRRELPV
jgi:predicted NBD/HSP70 family sugar kinase